MIVEVISRPYRQRKVGEQFKVKEKEARILVLLKRVKEVVSKPAEAPVVVPSVTADDSQPKRRGRKPGSKNKPK